MYRRFVLYQLCEWELPRWLSGKKKKNPPANASSIPGSGRSPGEGKGNLLQYSYLGNPMNRGDWQATVHGLKKELEVTQQLNNSSNIHLVYSVKIKLATYTA